MSSEMRSALLRVREAVTQEDESLFGYSTVTHGSGIPRAYSVRDNILCTIDRETALLARTEAGADGAVAAFRVRRDGDECLKPMWQDGAPDPALATEWTRHGYWIEYAYTHPHDASGDAELREFAQLVLHGIESGNIKSPLVTRKVDGDYKLESLYDIGVAAMQAKEAK